MDEAHFQHMLPYFMRKLKEVGKSTIFLYGQRTFKHYYAVKILRKQW